MSANDRSKYYGPDFGHGWDAFPQVLAIWAEKTLWNGAPAYVSYLPKHRRTDARKVVTVKKAPTREVLTRHFAGKDVGDLVALHSTSPQGTCRWIAIDLDCHADDPGLARRNEEFARAIGSCLLYHGLWPLVMDSDGRGGFHVLVPFSEPVPSELAYRFAKWLVQEWRQFGVPEPETFPKQPNLKGLKYGCALRLPGRHHTRDHRVRLLLPDGWKEGPAAANELFLCTGTPPGRIPHAARAYTPERLLVAQVMVLMMPPGATSPASSTPKPPVSPQERLTRARRYLERTPPAVQGERGDERFWKVACSFFRAFRSLTLADAFPLFQEWNARCDPPFPDHVVHDKLRRASQKAA